MRRPDKGNDNISKSQAELREWEKRYAGDWEYLRWPVCFTSGNSKFSNLWAQQFSLLRQWISDAATYVAAEIQHDYRDFRLERGLVTYGDQIALAKELLQHPVAAPRIREENFRVILDEAQDTEPAQFSVLLEAARPPHATGDWMKTRIRSAAARPLLHGRRFSAIDLPRPRRLDVLPGCAQRARQR